MRATNPVAIVGAGPVGLVTALLMRQQGYDPVVVERRATTSDYPAAHVVNTRTLEILDQLGLASLVQAKGTFIDKMPNIIWCESLAGLEFGRLAMHTASTAGRAVRRAISDFLPMNMAQNVLERLLLEHFLELGGEVCFRSEVVGLRQDETGVELRIRHGAEAGDESVSRFDYVIACDGAASTVRRELGVEMDGPRTLSRFLTIYFEADLSRHTAGRPGVLYWIGGLQVRGFVIAFDFNRTWALLCPIGEHGAAEFTTEVATELVRKMIGDPTTPFRITTVTFWNMSAQVAKQYRRGRVLLAGDAAHRFPPTGGLGMNTGIQDAHNLVWKLAAVMGGLAGSDLLDTYAQERRGIAQRNTAQSVRNLQRMGEIDEALGFPILAPLEPSALGGPLTTRPPSDFGLDDGSAAGRAKRLRVQESIDAQSEHFDDSLGTELGFCYEQGALEPDGTPAPPDDPRRYEPMARPGSRLPRVMLSNAQGASASTLQLISHRGLTLFSASQAWLAAGAGVAGVAVVGIGVGLEYTDPLDTWQAIFGISAHGMVLARPDGHVAFRSPGAASGDPALELESMIGRIFGLYCQR